MDAVKPMLIRVPLSLKRLAQRAARKQGISMNELMLRCFVQGLIKKESTDAR